MHDEAPPESDFDPSGHVVHMDDDEALAELWYDPAWQPVQAVEPAASEYDPAAHGEHVVDPGPPT